MSKPKTNKAVASEKTSPPEPAPAVLPTDLPAQTVDESPKPKVENSPTKPAAASAKTKEATKLALYDFVKQGWHVLEPVADFQSNWHLELICEYLNLIKNTEFRKKFPQATEGIIFNVPPRTMKSLLISVFFPLWVWTEDPARRFMFVSYSEKLSTQHSIYRRALMESEWFRNQWGNTFTISKDQNMKHHYENSHRGAMFSTGMQSTATGMGGDILIFDDPLNPEQALSDLEREAVNLRFDSTFRSRINDPSTGVKIIIMQRLHERDLTGHILSREKGRWEHICLPAIAEKDESWKFPMDEQRTVTRKPGDLLWEKRLSQEFLAAQKIGMGSWAFAGQYQQNPAPLEGGIIHRNWVRFYRQVPLKFDFLVQSWDCTFTASECSDYVAGQVWGRVGSSFYMLPHRIYDRLDFAPTKAAIKSCQALFPHAHAILVEDKANGPAIISELQKEIPGVIAISPVGGKMSRAQAMAPLWEAGNVYLPDPQEFKLPWLETYIHNICTFPRALHDDDMDATSQALIYMRKQAVNGIVEFYRRQAAAVAAPAATTHSIIKDGRSLAAHGLSANSSAPSGAD
jgi:predicted phage terminase large subunit-like protein